MKKSYDIKVIGSGFGGKIATIHIKVEFDPSSETINDLFKKACSASFRCGYNVLHLENINDAYNSKCIWSCKECDALGKTILELCDRIGLFKKWLEALEESEKTGEDVPVGNAIAGLNKWTGEYQVGGWTKKRMLEEIHDRELILSGIKSALDALGFDTEDNEAKKRILTNLGFYRVDANSF